MRLCTLEDWQTTQLPRLVYATQFGSAGIVKNDVIVDICRLVMEALSTSAEIAC